MKKTIFALLLVVALVVVLAIPAAAARSSETCICGKDVCTIENNPAHYDVAEDEWKPLPTDSLPTSGHFYLTEPVKLSAAWVPNGTLAIDLRGQTISVTDGGSNRLFEVTQSGSHLIITDSVGGGKLDYSSTNTTASYGYGILLNAPSAKVDMYGGTISGKREKAAPGKANPGGAAVALGSTCNATTSVFNMYGGTITGGTCDRVSDSTGQGGNVLMRRGVFNLYGGTVSNGRVNNGGKDGTGGNFFLDSNGAQATLNIHDGGSIVGGYSHYGGSIYARNNSAINMYGGEIRGVTENANGGVIYMTNTSTLTMTGGKITGHCPPTGNKGAAVLLDSSSKMVMTGGEISGNNTSKTSYGAGVHLNNANATLTVGGDARIVNNSNMNGASNVYVQSGTVKISTEKPLTGNARIGVTKGISGVTGVTSGTFVTSGAANAAGYFFSDIADYTVSLEGDALELKAINAFKVGENATNWSGAKNAPEVQLIADLATPITVGQNMTLDLAGHTLDEVNIADGVTLQVYDSNTSEYKDDDIGKIKVVNGKGTLAPNVLVENADGKTHKYLTLHEDDGSYSFHRFYLAVTYSVLQTGKMDMHYRVELKTNPTLAEKIKEIGIDLTVNTTGFGERKYADYAQQDKASFVVATTGFDTAGSRIAYLEATQYINAYIKIGEQKITSGVKNTSVQEMVQKAVKDWGKLEREQQDILADLYKAVDISGWKNIDALVEYVETLQGE